MDFEIVSGLIMVLGFFLIILGLYIISPCVEETKGWILIVIGIIFLFTPIIIFFTAYRSDTSKLSKKIENKEIISIEMNGLESTEQGTTYDYINSIVYIDDDGIKTKLDCDNYHLLEAKIKESADKKYHITINKKTLRATVYMPAGQTTYTTK